MITREVNVNGKDYNIDKTEVYDNQVISRNSDIVTVIMSGVTKSFDIAKSIHNKEISVLNVGFVGNTPVIHVLEDQVNKLYYLRLVGDTGFSLDNVYEITNFEHMVHSNGSIVTRSADKKDYYMLLVYNNECNISNITRTKFEKVFKNSTVIKAFLKQNSITITT